METLLGGRQDTGSPFAAEGYIGAVRALQRMLLTQFNVLARLLFPFSGLKPGHK
jgi:formate hydrogenlyase subunit 4